MLARASSHQPRPPGLSLREKIYHSTRDQYTTSSTINPLIRQPETIATQDYMGFLSTGSDAKPGILNPLTIHPSAATKCIAQTAPTNGCITFLCPKTELHSSLLVQWTFKGRRQCRIAGRVAMETPTSAPPPHQKALIPRFCVIRSARALPRFRVPFWPNGK